MQKKKSGKWWWSARMLSMSSNKVEKLRNEVWDYYKKNGRHDLPWRKTNDPYKIMVSEIMLQQTQVHRVVEKYREFLRKFPNVRALARAELSDVLRVWSGMGYNKRAKYLKDAARHIVDENGGRVPKAMILLRKLPGVGPYTASAIRVFAFNQPDVLIETNVRAVFIQHFFPHIPIILDSEILEHAKNAAEGQDPRKWHWALMDYGVHIKKLHQNPTRKSAHYVMQSSFDGSLRQVRGAVLKLLHTGSHGDLALAKKLSFAQSRIHKALESLRQDGLILSEKGSWRIV